MQSQDVIYNYEHGIDVAGARRIYGKWLAKTVTQMRTLLILKIN